MMIRSLLKGAPRLVVKAFASAVLIALPASAQMRIGYLSGSDVGWDGCINVINPKLDYLRNMGYTHVLFHVMGLTYSNTAPNPSDWATPNNSNLNTWAQPVGRRAEMENTIRAILSRNMIPIPLIASLTHNGNNRIPTVSWSPDNALVYPRGCTPWNEECAAFDANLEDVQIVYNRNIPGLGSRPPFLCIGHDEYIAPDDRGAPPPGSEIPPAQVALEMAARIAQIDARWPVAGGNSAVNVAIYGDSFLPNDNGVILGWVGDPITGAGGALDILTRPSGHNVNKNRLIVWPWAYGANLEWTGGQVRTIPLGLPPNNRFNQLRYLHNLGIPFSPITGEHGDDRPRHCHANDAVASYQSVDYHKRVFFEWAEAVTRVASPWFRGYSNSTYSAFDEAGSGTQVGYLMPFIRHAENFQSSYQGSYWSGFFGAFPYVLSRQTLSFNTSMLDPRPVPYGAFLAPISNSL
jgi:hypothetical protein